jgi:hypothetical protein
VFRESRLPCTGRKVLTRILKESRPRWEGSSRSETSEYCRCSISLPRLSMGTNKYEEVIMSLVASRVVANGGGRVEVMNAGEEI